MRVVIDTNVWISSLIGKLLAGLKNYVLDGLIEIVTTDEQIEEIVKVLGRPKFSKYFPDKDIEELLYLIQKTSKFVEIECKIEDCRDKKDNFILEIAVSGNADFIVTGDKDLIDLTPYKKTQIISYKEFEKVLEYTKRGKIK